MIAEKLFEGIGYMNGRWLNLTGQKIGALSGGMKQRLTLVQTVLGDTKILILDEPTAGLDPKRRISIRNFISKISFDKNNSDARRFRN